MKIIKEKPTKEDIKEIKAKKETALKSKKIVKK
jgi:hypothetical protein